MEIFHVLDHFYIILFLYKMGETTESHSYLREMSTSKTGVSALVSRRRSMGEDDEDFTVGNVKGVPIQSMNFEEIENLSNAHLHFERRLRRSNTLRHLIKDIHIFNLGHSFHALRANTEYLRRVEEKMRITNSATEETERLNTRFDEHYGGGAS